MEYNLTSMKMDVKGALRICQPHRALVTLFYLFLVSAGTALVNWIGGLLGAVSIDLPTLIEQLENAATLEEIEELGRIYGRLLSQILGPAGLIAVIASLICTIWSWILGTGYRSFCLAVSRRQVQPMEKIFSAFPMAWPIITTEFFRTLFTFLWSALVGIVIAFVFTIGIVLTASLPLLSALVAVAMTVALIAFMLCITMRYSMASYVLLDKGISGLQAVTESKHLMKGNYGRLLMLYLSFLNWYIPTFITIGMLLVIGVGAAIGTELSYGIAFMAIPLTVLGALVQSVLMLWLNPYLGTAEARFYDVLTGNMPSGIGPVNGGYYDGNGGGYGGGDGGDGGYGGGNGCGYGGGYGGGYDSGTGANNSPRSYSYEWTDKGPAAGSGSGSGTGTGSNWGNNPWNGNPPAGGGSPDGDNWDQGGGGSSGG